MGDAARAHPALNVYGLSLTFDVTGGSDDERSDHGAQQESRRRGRTTVPKAVRSALGVGYGDEVEFVVTGSGVSVRRAQAEEEDPVIMTF
jgi:AbrB family looped-hinge helix DNA binding protein